MKYYGTDGTQLKPDYFEKVEGQISISEDGNTYTITKNGKKETLQAKDPSKGAIDQNLARLNNEEKRLKKTKKEQGFIGKSWDWIKNTTGIGDGSDKAQKQIEAERKLLNQIKTGKISKKDFKEVTGLEYSKENLEKFKRGELSQATAKIDGYKEGQEMASDVAGDMISGIAAVGIYTAAVAAAPFTGGASIAVGVVAAGASAAAIKTGIKYADAKSGGREYTADNLKKDLATGAFSGVLAPITGGMGGAVGKTVATKMGIQAVKAGAGTVVEQSLKTGVANTVKTALINPVGYEYIGGSLVKRGLAIIAETATDGAIGGAVDNAFRTAYDGGSSEEVWDATKQGFWSGAILSPVITSGMKASGKLGQKVGEKVKSLDFSFSFSSIKANIEYLIFKRNFNATKIDKLWKPFKQLEKSIDETPIKYSDTEFMRFKQDCTDLSRIINDKYPSYIDSFEVGYIQQKANKFIKKWNDTHVYQQSLLENLTPLQARFVDRIMSSRMDEYEILSTITEAKNIETNVNAYMKEQYFYNKKAWQDLGYFDYEINSLESLEHATLILNNIKQNINKPDFFYLKKCDTIEQLYLYSKALKFNIDEYRIINICKDVKTKEDVEFVSFLFSKLKNFDNKKAYYYNCLTELGMKHDDLKPLLQNFINDSALLNNETLLQWAPYYLSQQETRPQAKIMLNYIMQHKSLQNPDFLEKHYYELFNCDSPQKMELVGWVK